MSDPTGKDLAPASAWDGVSDDERVDVERALKRAQDFAIKRGLPFRPWDEHVAEQENRHG